MAPAKHATGRTPVGHVPLHPRMTRVASSGHTHRMTSMTLPRLLLMCAALAAMALAPAPTRARGDDAGPSVRAMSDVAAAGFRSGVINQMKETGASDAAIECIRGVNGDALVPVVDALFANTLSRDEIAQFDAYMGSEVGRREVALTLTTLGRKTGDDAPEIPALTPEETEQVVAFQKAPLARKLMAAFRDSVRAVDEPGSIGHLLRERAGVCNER